MLRVQILPVGKPTVAQSGRVPVIYLHPFVPDFNTSEERKMSVDKEKAKQLVLEEIKHLEYIIQENS